MSPPEYRIESKPVAGRRGALIALVGGVIVGLGLVLLSLAETGFAGLDSPALRIRVNGLDGRVGRDVLLPRHGWVLQVDLPEGLPEAVADSLVVTIREERTGATVDLTERFEARGDTRSFVVPESLGLIQGLFQIQATLHDGAQALSQFRRLWIRDWLGGPPIGGHQVVHFDFGVDRDEDARPDFEQDLVRLGLLDASPSPAAPALADRIAARALARVRLAYDRDDDPNDAGLPRDVVTVRFERETGRTPVVTRICVGGVNHAHPGSIGNVRYDPGNAYKGRDECAPRKGDPPAGLFPSELGIYSEDALYRSTLAPFDREAGGLPVGADRLDLDRIEGRRRDARSEAIEEAIETLGDALGSVMAHEAGHALGLVPPGRPGVGLFGGEDEDGPAWAHNLHPADDDGPWLMDPGETLRFEDLAGRGARGPLRFRPLNHAYLRDRVVTRKRGAL